jgi:hypothetical protein
MAPFSHCLGYTASAVMLVFITALTLIGVNQGKIEVTQACVAYIIVGFCGLLGWLLRRISLKNRSLVLFSDKIPAAI